VVAATYYGNTVEYELDSDYGRLIGSAGVAGPAGARLGEGMPAVVEFDDTEAWLLPDTLDDEIDQPLVGAVAS
jgi:hypothetical protein